MRPYFPYLALWGDPVQIEMMKVNRFKNKDLFTASMNAISGLQILLREKSAHRELAILVFSVLVFLLTQDVYGALLLILSILMLSVEALNTAIEALADEVNESFRPRIKAAKDLGAAAVVLVIVAYGTTLLMLGLKMFSSYLPVWVPVRL